MVDSREKRDCCGCRACEQKCPTHAIEMVEDEKGFRYPQIDYELCTRCGLCDDVCAFDADYIGYGDDPAVYAVKNRDEDVRSSSTSGGMFVAISDEMLEGGGVIYGAGYKDRLYVCHKRATTKKGRDEFRGSKYVQSDIGSSFVQVKSDLENDMEVLFTGTPCQVVALKSFLRHDYHGLFTVDIVCHGTPSNKVWQDFLDVIEEETKNTVVRVDFRNKEESWHRPKTTLHLKRKRARKIRGEQSYFRLFVVNYMLMPSCHNCMYSNFNRASDITLGDFWGIENTMPDFDDDKGVSLVLVNSDKGRALFDNIRGSLDVRESCKQNCLQRNLQRSPLRHENSIGFWSDYHRRGMRYVMVKYTEYCVFKTFVKRCLRKGWSILTSCARKV